MSTLGDHIEVLSGFAFQSKKFNTEGHGLPLVRIRDVLRGSSDTYYDGEFEEKYIVHDGDLLIGMDGEFNRERWRGGRSLLNQRVCKVSPSSGALDLAYLYHLLPRILKRIEDKTPFVTVKHLSAKTLKEVEIPLPSPDEQRRIASILDKADAIRRKRREALAEIDALLRATFFDMFGDLARNPSNYPLKSIAELVDPERPITYGILMPGPDVVDGVPYIRVTDIQGGRVLVAQVRRTTSKIADEYRRSRLKPGDLLLSIRGHVGRMAFTPVALDGANVTQDTARLAIPNKVDAIYLRACLESPGFQHLMAQRTKGGAVKGINLGDVKALKIPMAPEKARKAFAEAWLHMQVMIDRGRQSLQEAEQLFASLSQRAFRGEL